VRDGRRGFLPDERVATGKSSRRCGFANTRLPEEQPHPVGALRVSPPLECGLDRTASGGSNADADPRQNALNSTGRTRVSCWKGPLSSRALGAGAAEILAPDTARCSFDRSAAVVATKSRKHRLTHGNHTLAQACRPEKPHGLVERRRANLSASYRPGSRIPNEASLLTNVLHRSS